MVTWVTLVSLQRADDRAFFWASIEAVWLIWLAALPWLWLTLRDPGAPGWCLRLSRQPRDSALAGWIGISLYGAASTATALLFFITVDRIQGGGGLWRVGGLAVGSILWLVPLASFAPALACLSTRKGSLTVMWLLLVGSSFSFGVPVPTGALLTHQPGDLNHITFTSATVIGAALASGAGGFISVGLAHRQLASTTSCASASSATSTATSKP